MRTYMPKVGETERKWFVVDADGKTLGRLASRVARVLMGKEKPVFTSHVDCGDHVIVVNASRVKLTGKKWNDKMYYRHSGYPGGLKEESAVALLARKPQTIVEQAVFGMLPKSKLGRDMRSKLKVYSGPEHPHQAQVPEALTP